VDINSRQTERDIIRRQASIIIQESFRNYLIRTKASIIIQESIRNYLIRTKASIKKIIFHRLENIRRTKDSNIISYDNNGERKKIISAKENEYILTSNTYSLFPIEIGEIHVFFLAVATTILLIQIYKIPSVNIFCQSLIAVSAKIANSFYIKAFNILSSISLQASIPYLVVALWLTTIIILVCSLKRKKQTVTKPVKTPEPLTSEETRRNYLSYDPFKPRDGILGNNNHRDPKKSTRRHPVRFDSKGKQS
jgi:hypothetical protein